jgi:hypothetical protein
MAGRPGAAAGGEPTRERGLRMRHFTRLVAAGLALAALGGAACAQEDFDRGKTGAQLYASDCAICHKSVQRLNPDVGGLFGLRGFLEQHYTASREAAAAVAAYLQSVQREAGPQRRESARAKKRGEGEPKARRPKSAEKKTTGGKSEETKPAEKKAEPEKKKE